MLVHEWDAGTDEEWRAFVASQSVGTLVVPTDDLPVVVPTHYVWDGSCVLLHLARPNPALQALRDRALFSVHGDWAYVPSAWKAVGEEDPALGIPTSLYAAVTLTCSAEVLEGDQLLDVLRTTLAAFEPGSGVADPSVHERRLPGIKGIRLTPVTVQAKFKYGGNLDDDHRAHVAERLRETGQDRALAQLERRSRYADADPA
jgi:transcriptional regulator